MAAGDALSSRFVTLRARIRGRIPGEPARRAVDLTGDPDAWTQGRFFDVGLDADPRPPGSVALPRTSFFTASTRRRAAEWGEPRARGHSRSDTRRHLRRRHVGQVTILGAVAARALSSRGALVRCALLSRVPLDDRSRGRHCAEFRTRFRGEDAPPSWGRD